MEDNKFTSTWPSDLRAFATLAEDLNSVFNNHVVIHKLCNSSERNPNILFWLLRETYKHVMHYTQPGKYAYT